MTVHCNNSGCRVSWPRDPVLEVACPTCGAGVGSPCKRPSGHKAMSPHGARDIAADRAGAYGRCPSGRCGLDQPAQLGLGL